MDKLVALPVSGDAFLLRRECWSILVDGGYSSRALLSALSASNVNVKHLDIVVCTHADKDHAGGLTDFLDKEKVTVGEFWLPGAWMDSLPQLLQNPHLVMDELVTEIKGLVPQNADDFAHDDDSFESQMHSHILDTRKKAQRNDEGMARTKSEHGNEKWGLGWLKQLIAGKEQITNNDSAPAKAFNSGRRRVRYWAATKSLNPQLTTFWVDLINTAERIRKIAVQAIRHDVQIRWFDFGAFVRTGRALGGVPGVLTPLNSVELEEPPHPIYELAYLARLTPVNEECLVFLSPPGHSPNGLGVVFTGDSPLGHGTGYSRPLLDWPSTSPSQVVATAPHHGSESNAAAYNHLNSLTNVLLWLRSGGSSKHPGKTFRGLHSAVRGCTHCPHLHLGREIAEVQLSTCTLFWPFILRVRSHDCIC